MRQCSLLRHVRIKEGTQGDYRKLEWLHYRGAFPSLAKKIYVARYRGQLVGAIVYGNAHLNLRARNFVLPSLNLRKTTRETSKLVNKLFLRIWRVVFLPKFRPIGLGVRLVKNTLAKVHMPYVETLAVMAKYNPFFGRAGMMRVHLPDSVRDRGYQRALSQLQERGSILTCSAPINIA